MTEGRKKLCRVLGMILLACGTVGVFYVFETPTARAQDVLSVVIFYGMGIYLLWLVNNHPVQKSKKK